MNKRCALMNCELEEEDISLEEIIRQLPNSKASYQAELLIKQHGFKKTDILCLECFWK